MLTTCHHGQNRLCLGKINLNYCLQNKYLIINSGTRNKKTHYNTTFPPPFLRLRFTPDSLVTTTTPVVQREWAQGVHSLYLMVSLCHFPLPLGFPLLFPHSFCSLFLSPSGTFCPFLNTCSRRLPTRGCWVQLCPSVGLLEPARTTCVWHGAVPGLSSQMLSRPCYGHPIYSYILFIWQFFILQNSPSGQQKGASQSSK